MSLFDIAFKNIKRNFQNYFLYFTSIAFSILIYFTFTSLQYNDQIAKALGAKASIAGAFKASAVVILVFAGVFIWYSNSFFTKKRKKEIALYSMLGLKKKQIGRMLFYETVVMGVIALVVGIALGSLLSKGFIALLFKLMDMQIIKTVSFSISMKAVGQTIGVFAIIFLIISIHSYSLIYRFKLIDLFRAEERGESQPKVSTIISLLGVIMVGSGYYFASNLDKNFQLYALLTITLTIAGTYILFSSFVVFMIKQLKKNKKRYFNGINMIGTSQLLYRIKGNARTLATIAILSATTLTAVGTTFSIYYFADKQARENSPYSYGFVTERKTLNADKKSKFDGNEAFIVKDLKKDNINKDFESMVNKYPKNKIDSKYEVDVLTKNVIFPKTSSKGPNEDEESIAFISESTAKNLIKASKLDIKLNLEEKEAFVFERFVGSKFVKSFKEKTFKLNNDVLTISGESNKALLPVNLVSFNIVVVVSDNVFNNSQKFADEYLKLSLYNVKNESSAKELTEEFNNLTKNTYKDISENTFMLSSDYYTQYRGAIETSGLTVFIGSFLGLVFLICTGSIIFFKQLSESNADKFNYDILKKVGVSNKELKVSISKQIGIVFLLPLVVGITHSTFALKVLESLLNMSLLKPILITYVIYSIIYLVYYFITVRAYYKAVTQ
ncbi:ABC transporter permease [Clostridium hydrogeniformans]|uniref:ABC transporter permease n=1 Tax=Clostridium hydrogeniformans TaxID=349933 RepID=UPI00048604CD|nr:ABC transporter permease [Clostridium hydrogeniformans]